MLTDIATKRNHLREDKLMIDAANDNYLLLHTTSALQYSPSTGLGDLIHDRRKLRHRRGGGGGGGGAGAGGLQISGIDAPLFDAGGESGAAGDGDMDGKSGMNGLHASKKSRKTGGGPNGGSVYDEMRDRDSLAGAERGGPGGGGATGGGPTGIRERDRERYAVAPGISHSEALDDLAPLRKLAARRAAVSGGNSSLGGLGRRAR